ncbi:hypothetical protein PPTG_07990 [Phytophthora nicotianae INRA-310]|uniref:HAT C-terminal dimerisation domain-containing protein n=1 Tax=Phytophthora nicotianae (strain INRA-310) TaxID=761204 RepID=W2QKH0_PHYN3|nr:hypothetical protein PPTG_07990 [Phytophthora nicotianae INRA-310]ETN13044.1 hypothetical protein PPTG_07990 [Phytophthora nicotianae INRA-310]
MSTYLSISYLDVRIRVYYNEIILNLHLLAIPMHEGHTGEAMFDAVVPVLDVRCPNWRDVMLGITTDGERKMTGVNKGLATRFQKVCRSGFMRVWCGLHQLDLALQNTFKAAMKGRFFGYMTQTIAYLRRQGTLIRQMDTTAPLFQDTRWELIATVQYLVYETPSNIDSTFRCQNTVITFRSLEGTTALVTEQMAQMKKLSSDIQIMFGVRAVGDEDNSELDNRPTTLSLAENNAMVCDHAKILDLLQDNGSFAIKILDTIGTDAATLLASDLASVMATFVERVNSIEPKRNEKNEPVEGELPPSLPREFVKLQGRDLSALILKHRDRMAPHWTGEQIDAIEQEHSALCDQYRRHEQFRRSIDNDIEKVCTFEDAWNNADGKSPILKRFAGGLATTFPGTSTVESDFSILKWEKPPSKSRLTSFSLEGLLHAKQFALLNSIKVSSDGKPGDTSTTNDPLIS